MGRALMAAIRARVGLWFSIALGFVAAYHALLLAAMIARFGHLPNFVKVYDILESYRLTFSGTPSWRDALSIAAGEPWLDIGYMSPQWRIAEWSLMILPPQFLLVTFAGFALATYGVVALAARNAPCARSAKGTAVPALLGTSLVGMANATLFWVVCCATPTWIVGLAMLGVSVSVAFLLEPLGPFLTAGGMALIAGATAAQARRIDSSAMRLRGVELAREAV